jgi:hypothetical protein
MGLKMKKALRRSFLIIVFLGFLIPFSFYFINFSSFDTKNNRSQLNTSGSSSSKSGTVQLSYNEYFGVGGVKNMNLKFNFKSYDLSNNSKYVDILYRVMSGNNYDLLRDYYNRTGNLEQILKVYPFKNLVYFDTAHYCMGYYFKTGSPMYLVFVNLEPNQTTIKVSYQLEFYPSSDSTTSEPPDDNPTSSDDGLPYLFNPIVLMFIIMSIFMGIIIIILSVSRSHFKNHTEEIPKLKYRYESLSNRDVVSYCAWCGYKLKRVEKYCPRCGKEIEY